MNPLHSRPNISRSLTSRGAQPIAGCERATRYKQSGFTVARFIRGEAGPVPVCSPPVNWDVLRRGTCLLSVR